MSLEPGRLTLKELRRFAAGVHAPYALGSGDRARMQSTREIIERRTCEGLVTYGVNTGLGTLAGNIISDSDLTELQRRLILANAAGTGGLMSERDVRCMMLLKAAALATGRSGARPELVDALLALVAAGITPCVPAKGSVGASGDLAPLAHMGAALIGVGDVSWKGRSMAAAEALEAAGLAPFELASKEGLAIVNGTQASTALAVSGLVAAEAVFSAAVVAGMLSLEAALGRDLAFDARLHEARGQAGQIEVAAAYRGLLAGSGIRSMADAEDRLQDPYCLRCQPQVMGACFDQLTYTAKILAREVNAWTDNPMVDPETGDILYGGNFHAEPVGMAADAIAVALAEIGAMSERRVALLIDPHHSRLPAFLVKEAGLNSGFMVAQVTAAALASENKSLAHPATVDSIPTTANLEDFVSMATFAARRLSDMADNVAAIVAIELLAACQGLEFRRPARSSKRLEAVHARIRDVVQAYDQDRFFAPDIESVKVLVKSGVFVEELPAGLTLI